MKVKATRVHFYGCACDNGLVATINQIGYENILNIMPCMNNYELFYTIIYREKESWE